MILKTERNVSKDSYYVVNYQAFLLPETRALVTHSNSPSQNNNTGQCRENRVGCMMREEFKLKSLTLSC